MTIITNQASGRIVLKPEAIARVAQLAGTASKVELAERLGEEPAILAMAASGASSPSIGLLARIVTAFPQLRIASLCEVV